MPKLLSVIENNNEWVLMTEEELHRTELSWKTVLNQVGRDRWKDNPPSRFRVREYNERIDYEPR